MTVKSKSRNTTGLKPAWKKGQSGNPKGRPKLGSAWADLVRNLGDMKPAQVKEWLTALGRRLPNADATLKELAVLAAYVDCIHEPNARMLQTLMDRTDGRPSQAVELSGNSDKPVRILVEYADGDSAAAALGSAEGQG